ncbi:MAG: Acid phosphatase/vanadium-dependent haloperoxidase-related protein [Clostridia bacterium]|jgi:acid phosphatase family membrane protein YuiD|nr:Acid phosphatase/vanadium-dependent haloperoxidase-related protein [Clostridia bacterium]
MNFTIVDSVLLLSISSITTVVFVQMFKTILNSILIGKFDIKTLLSDGDFPSSHTAILVSFNIVFWNMIYSYSINNPNTDMFSSILVGLVLALWSCYEIRDAMGVRLRVQEHAHAIKQIALTSKDISDKIEKLKLIENDINSRALEEELDDILSNIKLKAGHLPHEVLGGIITGGLIGLLFIFGANANLQLLILVALIFAIYVTLTILIFIRKRKKDEKE